MGFEGLVGNLLCDPLEEHFPLVVVTEVVGLDSLEGSVAVEGDFSNGMLLA